MTAEATYFHEAESHFRHAAGKSPLWRMSTKDWSTVDSWHSAGVPLDAVLRAIDICCEKGARPSTLAYCERVVMDMCHRMPAAAPDVPQMIELPARLNEEAFPAVNRVERPVVPNRFARASRT